MERMSVEARNPEKNHMGARGVKMDKRYWNTCNIKVGSGKGEILEIENLK